MKSYKSLVLAAVVLVGGMATASNAATLFFSTSDTNPGNAPSDPTITLGANSTATLYIWAQANQNEAINGLGLNEIDSNPIISATGSAIYNPSYGSGRSAGTRWQTPVNSGTVGTGGSTTLVSGINAVYVSGNATGIDGFNTNGTYVAQGVDATGTDTGSELVGELDLTSGSTGGTSNIFFQVGTATISFETNLGGPGINFGAGDAAVNGATVGAVSSLPDATVIVSVPEPASLSLLGLGAMGLIARRRKA